MAKQPSISIGGELQKLVQRKPGAKGRTSSVSRADAKIRGTYKSERQLIETVVAKLLPGRFPTPEGCTEDPGAKRILSNSAVTDIAAAFLAQDRDSAAARLQELLTILDPSLAAFDASDIRKHEETDWDKNKANAVKLLREAASLLEDPAGGMDSSPLRQYLELRADDPIRKNLDFELPPDMGSEAAIAW